jgi:hypothetical protein
MKRKLFQRIVCFVLSVTLLLGSLCIGSFAKEGAYKPNGTAASLEEMQAVVSTSGYDKYISNYPNANKGKTLETLGHCKTTQVVDLKEITSVGIFRVFNVALLVLGIILMFTSIAVFASLGDQSSATAVVIGTFAVGLILMLTAFISARRVLRIEYAGGSIAVDMRSFSKKDCENFRIALFRAKDNITNYR